MKSIHKEMSVQEVAVVVANRLESQGIWAVLVGGSCVTIYSKNQFMSYDLDFVSYDPLSKIKEALGELGFVYDKKKYFVHPECAYFLDFLTPPVAIGNEPVSTFSTMVSPLGELQLLTPTDCVKDRLAAFYHWGDLQSLDQAVCVAKEQKVELSEITRWSENEKNRDKCKEFLKLMNEEKT